MKLINASAEILEIHGADLKLIEKAGRTCYKSEDRITDDSALAFARSILARHHESVIEHSTMTVRFIVDRGVSHELVRHRLASFSQESTRYVRYDGAKEGRGLTFVRPCFWLNNPAMMDLWESWMRDYEEIYLDTLDLGAKPEEARCLLPHSTKTEVVMTANFREWRKVFELRTANAAHPQMREVMRPLLAEARRRVPVIFDDAGEV